MRKWVSSANLSLSFIHGIIALYILSIAFIISFSGIYTSNFRISAEFAPLNVQSLAVCIANSAAFKTVELFENDRAFIEAS